MRSKRDAEVLKTHHPLVNPCLFIRMQVTTWTQGTGIYSVNSSKIFVSKIKEIDHFKKIKFNYVGLICGISP